MFHAKNKYDSRIIDTDELIPPDEPVFLLRGQDKFAAETVRFWAEKVRATNPELAETAFQHSLEMDRWPIKKDPDE